MHAFQRRLCPRARLFAHLRASLPTGRYPTRVGITHYIPGHAIGRMADVPYFHFLPKNERDLASALRDGGYPRSRTDSLSH